MWLIGVSDRNSHHSENLSNLLLISPVATLEPRGKGTKYTAIGYNSDVSLRSLWNKIVDRRLGNHADITGLWPLFARNDIEFDFSPFLKDGTARVVGVNEHILAPIVWGNKTEPFTRIKKLHSTLGHFFTSIIKSGTSPSHSEIQ